MFVMNDSTRTRNNGAKLKCRQVHSDCTKFFFTNAVVRDWIRLLSAPAEHEFTVHETRTYTNRWNIPWLAEHDFDSKLHEFESPGGCCPPFWGAMAAWDLPFQAQWTRPGPASRLWLCKCDLPVVLLLTVTEDWWRITGNCEDQLRASKIRYYASILQLRDEIHVP